MQGIVRQVNISGGGIPKLPVEQGKVTRSGIEGDSWAHRRYHGGPKQALLLIAQEDLDTLKQQGFPVYGGALGENLTVEGLAFRNIRLGDRFRIGDVLLEITKLRQPCRTLNAVRKGIQLELYDTNPGAPKWGRGGFYARVLEEGKIRAGDRIETADHDV